MKQQIYTKWYQSYFFWTYFTLTPFFRDFSNNLHRSKLFLTAGLGPQVFLLNEWSIFGPQTCWNTLYHTVRNLHFLSKNSTLIFRENCRFFWVKNSWKCCGFRLFSCWQLWFHEKNCQKKYWVKNSWKCCGFGLFSFWQLWFHEKNCIKKLDEKLVKMLGFVKIEFLDKNLTFRIVCLQRKWEAHKYTCIKQHSNGSYWVKYIFFKSFNAGKFYCLQQITMIQIIKTEKKNNLHTRFSQKKIEWKRHLILY